jgi:hypothetical protein
MQRRMGALLNEADAAVTANEWGLVAAKARAVLAIQQLLPSGTYPIRQELRTLVYQTIID